MDTITIPRTDYIDRIDDESNVYHARRTVEAAAELWREQDAERRAWDRDDEGRLTFACPGTYGLHITVACADEEMEGLYRADDLPFAFAASPFAPGDVIVHNITGASHHVTRIGPSGDVYGDRLNGSISVTVPAAYVSEYHVARDATAPTGTPAAEVRTFVVTVPASEVDMQDMCHALLTGLERDDFTVREAR